MSSISTNSTSPTPKLVELDNRQVIPEIKPSVVVSNYITKAFRALPTSDDKRFEKMEIALERTFSIFNTKGFNKDRVNDIDFYLELFNSVDEIFLEGTDDIADEYYQKVAAFRLDDIEILYDKTLHSKADDIDEILVKIDFHFGIQASRLTEQLKTKVLSSSFASEYESELEEFLERLHEKVEKIKNSSIINMDSLYDTISLIDSSIKEKVLEIEHSLREKDLKFDIYIIKKNQQMLKEFLLMKKLASLGKTKYLEESL